MRSAYSALKVIEQRNATVAANDWAVNEQESARSLAFLIDQIGRQVYFASGAQEGKRQNLIDEDGPYSRARIDRFYRETHPILEYLAEVGLPSLTHQLLETLEFFIPLDPAGVFICIGRVVRAGRQSGYQYESLAADLIVQLVERYLAEYRPLFREDEDCRRTLIEILDIFVQAGWPAARRLTYRLDEIFR